MYVTLLASVPSLSPNLRSSIKLNLTEIIVLHEELLGDLHKAVPHSEYSQATADDSALTQQPKPIRHHRWRSLDAVPDAATGASWLQKIPGMTAEPKIAADVAKVFGKKVRQSLAAIIVRLLSDIFDPDEPVLCLRRIWCQIRDNA